MRGRARAGGGLSDRPPVARLAQLAAAHPDGVALAVDGGQALSFAAWAERSDAAARALAGALPAGARVALCFDPRHWTDYAVAWAAVRGAGMVAVPVLAALGERELAALVRDCAPAALIAGPGLDPASAGSVPVLSLDALAAASPRPEPLPGSGDRELVYPRVVPLAEPRALVRIDGELAAPPPPLLHAFPPGTLAGQEAMRSSLAGPAHPAAGGSLVLARFDAERLCELIEHEPDRACGLDPAAARALLDSGAAARHDARGLRRLVLFGGPAAPALLERLRDAFPAAELTVVENPPAGRAAPAKARGAAPADVAPLASSQVGMIWQELFAPGVQNLPGLARRYRGPLDIGALRRALEEIVRRHGALRTSFELRGTDVVQVVRAPERLELPVRDLQALDCAERERELEREIERAGSRPFDLAGEPLFAPTLVRLGPQDHVLVIRAHHSVFDDWSVGVFRRQLARLYDAFAAGAPSPLPEPPLQFADFARRQQAELAGGEGERQRAFWRRELAGAPLSLQLPVDDPAAPAGSPQPAGGPEALVLDATLAARLRELAARERVSVYMTLLAAFAVLAHRYTAQRDLLLSTVVANRNRSELEGIIGCFTKKLPLRLRVDGAAPFTSLLASVRAALLDALANQDLAFEEVIQDVLGAQAAAHGLVPQPAVVFQGVTPEQPLALSGVESEGLGTAARAQRAHFLAGRRRGPALPWGAGLYTGTLVIVSVEDAPARLALHARGAFHPPAVRDLLGRFATLLADIAADPARPVSALALLDAPAEREVLALGRGAKRPAPAGTLAEAFAAQARRDPDAPAVRWPGGALSFAQLEQQAGALARRLREAGVAPGALVATELPASPELVIAVLAIWRRSAAWLGLDPAADDEHRSRIVQAAAPNAVIGADGISPVRPPPGRAATRLPPGTAVVVSGGEGEPVPVGERALLNLIAALELPAPAGPRTALCPQPTEDAFVRRLVALAGGDRLFVARGAGADPGRTLELLRRGELDLLDATAERLRALLDAGLARGLPEGAQATVVAGTRGALAPELWAALRRVPGLRVQVLYGSPHCGFAATGGEEVERGVGRPLPGVAVRVLDRSGRPTPLRALGELCVAGAGVSGGQAAAAPGPLHPAEPALVRTGQLARLLPGGGVEIAADAGSSRVLRGFCVEPGRIEAALSRCRGLAAVAVVLEPGAGGEPELVGHFPPPAPTATPEALRAAVWAAVPGYASPSRLVPAGARVLLPEAALLAALWAEVLGRQEAEIDTNYWQRFGFLSVLARAREAGLAIGPAEVTRNRTLANLAAALAAGRLRSGR